VRDVVSIVLCVLGLAFSLTGAVGIVRMPDVYTRVQCSSKTITLGALPLLAGFAVAEGVTTTYGARALIVAGLLLVMNPVASHALVRAAYRSGEPMWAGAVADEPRTDRPDGAEPGGAGTGRTESA
jgi:multicomponent Na+:H+ antiporter subunit G